MSFVNHHVNHLALQTAEREARVSPKSVALPVEAIVINSITLLLAPSPYKPLILLEEEPLAIPVLATVKSPKSVALPVDAIVIYSKRYCLHQMVLFDHLPNNL